MSCQEFCEEIDVMLLVVSTLFDIFPCLKLELLSVFMRIDRMDAEL